LGWRWQLWHLELALRYNGFEENGTLHLRVTAHDDTLARYVRCTLDWRSSQALHNLTATGWWLHLLRRRLRLLAG